MGGGHIEFCLRVKFMPWSQKLKFSVRVFFLLAYFWGVLTSHEKMFDEVGNDSVMRQACYVYTVRDLF